MLRNFIKRNMRMNKEGIQILVSYALFIAIILSPLSPFVSYKNAEAAFNKQINYQGKLTDASNVSVANGTYNMEFKLYTASSGGSAIWTETRTGADKVTVSSGLFSVLLGEVNSLAGVDFNQTLYLGVNIGGTGTPGWDGEMTPRKKLGAVPAAVMAETVTGAAQTAITSLGTLTGLTVTGSTTLRGLTVDNAVATQDRIAISPAAVETNRFDGTITNADLTATRTWTLPDNSGTFALTSDIPVVTGFVPYTGATSNVDLGVHNLTVDTNSLFVDSVNHRVGMGTTSPTSALSFASNSRINSVAGNMFYGSFGDTIFEAGGASEKIRILGTNGNVGIGTNNPSSKFTVSGGGSGTNNCVACPALSQCCDCIDNNSNGLIDKNDPNCHAGGVLQGTYDPAHDSESTAPAASTGGGTGGGGGSGGDLGFFFNRVRKIFNYSSFGSLLGSVYNSLHPSKL